jgi:hypothetical protein
MAIRGVFMENSASSEWDKARRHPVVDHPGFARQRVIIEDVYSTRNHKRGFGAGMGFCARSEKTG